MNENLSIRRADLADEADAATVVALLDEFARDPMSADAPLSDEVLERLIPGLRALPTSLVWFAELSGRAVGISVAFVGFSTFRAMPLINVHDLAVMPDARGRGVGRALLAAIESHARETGCCLLTLEVFENNLPAKGLYESSGFRQATYTEEAGGALFYKKPL